MDKYSSELSEFAAVWEFDEYDVFTHYLIDRSGAFGLDLDSSEHSGLVGWSVFKVTP